MTAKLTQSRFRNVYIGLSAIWFAMGLSICIFLDSYMIPKLLEARVSDVESLVRSQREALLFKDNRATRDMLQRRGIITDDRAFEQLTPSSVVDRAKVNKLLSSCTMVMQKACIGKRQALFFSEPASSLLQGKQSSFIVVLDTDYFSHIYGITLWKVLGFLILGIAFGFAGCAIRQQEKFLLQKIALLVSSLSNIESSLRTDDKSSAAAAPMDEFTLISQSIEQAGLALAEKTQQIEDYKKNFKKRAQIEQLAQTIGYTSHNLKAPLLEGVDFLKNLPEFIETMPREKLLRSIASLEKRFLQGADSLQQALNSTRDTHTTPEPIRVVDVLKDFQSSIHENPSLSGVKIEINTEECREPAQVFCVRPEIDAALWNLFKNSLDAKSDSHIQIRAFTHENEAVVHFQDDGPGIPASVRESIFNDFFTTKSTGTGLGLAGVRRTISRLNGTIQALPATDGALFEIRLPLIDVSPGTMS